MAIGAEITLLADVEELSRAVGQTGLDACTLNNALNIAQLVALVAIVKWLRASSSAD